MHSRLRLFADQTEGVKVKVLDWESSGEELDAAIGDGFDVIIGADIVSITLLTF